MIRRNGRVGLVTSVVGMTLSLMSSVFKPRSTERSRVQISPSGGNPILSASGSVVGITWEAIDPKNGLFLVIGLVSLVYGCTADAMASETASSVNKTYSCLCLCTSGLGEARVGENVGAQDSLQGGRKLTLLFQDAAPSFALIFHSADRSQEAQFTGKPGDREYLFRVPEFATTFELDIGGSLGVPVSLSADANGETVATIRLEASLEGGCLKPNGSKNVARYEITITSR